MDEPMTPVGKDKRPENGPMGEGDGAETAEEDSGALEHTDEIHPKSRATPIEVEIDYEQVSGEDSGPPEHDDEFFSESPADAMTEKFESKEAKRRRQR